MAMKMMLIFQIGRQVWGENHYWGAGVDPDGAAETAAAVQLAQARAQLMGLNCFLIGVRLTSPTVKRNVTTLRFNPPLESSFTNEAENEGTLSADIGNTSVMVVVKTVAQGKQFRVYMAGCIDGAIQTDPSFPDNIVPNPNFIGAFNNWRSFITAAQAWGTVVKTNPQSAAVGQVVTNAQFPGLVGVQLPVPLVVGGGGLAVGDHLQLRGFRRTNLASPDLNGIWQIAGVVTGAGTITTYYLMGSQGVDPLNFWKIGLAQTVLGVFDAYKTLQIEGARTRKRGESIEARRGRSRTRRLRG